MALQLTLIDHGNGRESLRFFEVARKTELWQQREQDQAAVHDINFL